MQVRHFASRFRAACARLRGRRPGRVVVVGIAAAAVVTLAGGSAVAAGMVTSGDIRNQTIESHDIGASEVGRSEVRTGAVGQTEIRRSGVDQTEIENQSIRSWDISAGGVGTSEIRDGHVRQEDLSADVRSQLGNGPKGERGDDGVSGYEVDGFYTRDGAGDPDPDAGRDGDLSLGPPVAPGEVVQLVSFCAPGKHAIGGGFSNGNTEAGSDLTVRESHPAGFEPIEGDRQGSVRATGWAVTVENETGAAQHAQVWVVCAAIAEAGSSS